ncbi:MAG: carbohydrate porin [Pseudomonadota bacterium]|nr:carbohydrate porin [Pseudomonadota bacterium]
MRNTVNLMLKGLPLAMLCLASAAFANDDEGQYIGYFRSGAGASSGGGVGNCYYLGNGNGHGYRLGNECDSYGELGYAKTLATSENGVKFVGHAMIADYSGSSFWGNNNGGLYVSQMYVEAKGIDSLAGGTAWLGERYYERPDIHTMDLQYINLNGQGGGIDNIPTSTGGKFSYAIFKDNDSNVFGTNNTIPGTTNLPASTGSNSAIRNDFLLRGIPVNPGGKLDLVFGYISASSSGNDRHNGFNAHLFHNQSIFGGNNTFGLQYGVGPGTGRGDPIMAASTAAYQANPQAVLNGGTGPNGGNGLCCNRMGLSGSTLLGSDDTRTRVFDFLVIQPTKEFSASFDVVYQADKLSALYGPAQGTVTWTSFGVRPEYAFSQNFKLQAEIGYDRMSYPNAPSQNLTKVTIAPTFTFGPGFWDRPEMRLFVTHATWNNAATATIAANNYNQGNSIGMGNAGTTVGIQVETWWNEDWW